jgi:hypothetical protein
MNALAETTNRNSDQEIMMIIIKEGACKTIKKKIFLKQREIAPNCFKVQ